MKRIRALGLGVVMALALTAVVVPGMASASWTEIEHKWWKGQQVGPEGVLAVNAGLFKCPDASFLGRTTGTGGESTQLVASLDMGPCEFSKYPGIGNLRWDMNGCKFLFNMENSEPHTGTADIINCNSPIEFKATYAGGILGCQILIPEQSGLKTLIAESNGSGDDLKLGVDLNAGNLSYMQSGIDCTKGSYSSGDLFIEWDSKQHQPVFMVENGTGTISGEELGMHKLFVAENEMRCYEAKPSLKIASKAEELSFDPNFNECEFIGLVVDPDMGSCTFELSAMGTFGITGEKCATDPIEVHYSAFFGLITCVVTIGPELGQGLGEVSYSNEGIGSERYVEAAVDVSSLDYTAIGNGCAEGSFFDGKYIGELKLTATDGEGTPQGLWIE